MSYETNRQVGLSLKWLCLTCVFAVFPLVQAAPASAQVTADEALVKFGSFGSGAGQFKFPPSVAASPVNGHIFLTDEGNRRIDEFTPWGDFVKAFGWDVAPGAVNEQQEVVVKATAGQFKLGFESSTTPDLARDATATELASALNALPSLAGGSVEVQMGSSDLESTRYLVIFSGGDLAGEDVTELSATDGTTPLSGGDPASGASVSTRADGTPGGTGLESCTAESGCKAGVIGNGAGQVDISAGIQVSAEGDVYLREKLNPRLQKFDSAGRFEWAIGGEVNKTTGGSICLVGSGDVCGAGVPGTGPREFADEGAGIGLSVTGTLLIPDADRIQEIDLDGNFLSESPLPGRTGSMITVAPTNGDIFVNFTDTHFVTKFDPSGIEQCSFAIPPDTGITPVLPGALAADSHGGVFVANRSGYDFSRISYFDGTCPADSPVEFELEYLPGQGVTAIAVNAVDDLIVARYSVDDAFVQIYGPPPVEFEPPPTAPPLIGSQFTLDADTDSATVKAEIDPQFWSDTSYYVEWGTGECSDGGCPNLQPSTPLPLGAGAVRELRPTAEVELSGLQPGTTYHYRFVAQSSGGGPVKGVGGTTVVDGTEAVFTTQPAAEPEPGACPNQARRAESSSTALPDCRAYEMVSPVDKNGGDVLDMLTGSGFRSQLTQTASDGDSVTYSSYRAFPGAGAALYASQYLAKRSTGGWTSRSLAPARGGTGVLAPGEMLENMYEEFTPDLCHAWLVHDASPLLDPDAIAGFPNLYREDLCEGESVAFDALTTGEPEGPFPFYWGSPKHTIPELQGTGADSAKAVYRSPWKMAPEGAEGVHQVYEASPSGVKLVCLLPNGDPLDSACSAGAGAGQYFKRRGSVLTHAISEDGSRIYWTAAADEKSAGKIYVRVDGSETRKVSEAEGEGKTSFAAEFMGASADGSLALFKATEGPKAGRLFQYSLEDESSTKIAGELVGVAAMSDDLSRVYFVSREALEGAAVKGEPNLYLREGEETRFIVTLGAGDVRVADSADLGAASNTVSLPVFHVAKATPDGEHLIFISARPLTGFDNVDAVSGEPDSEVFRYDAGDASLACVSCHPLGVRPRGRRVGIPGGATPFGGGAPWTAAAIPAGQSQLYTPRAQSDDGSRVFFTAYTPLLPRDTNGQADVYLWRAPQPGSECEEGGPRYSPRNAGCLSLITTGKAPGDSEFLDSTPSGNDVFFTTEESILPQDPGSVDVYDARVEGGLPVPSAPDPCAPGGCRQPQSPPSVSAPGSSGASEGNPPVSRKCPKGKRRVIKKGKVRCVKPKPRGHRGGKGKGSGRKTNGGSK